MHKVEVTTTVRVYDTLGSSAKPIAVSESTREDTSPNSTWRAVAEKVERVMHDANLAATAGFDATWREMYPRS